MDQYNESQQYCIDLAQKLGFPVYLFMNPDLSAERMNALLEYLMDQKAGRKLDPAGLNMLLDRSIRDGDAWNLLHALRLGGTVEKFIRDNDEA